MAVTRFFLFDELGVLRYNAPDNQTIALTDAAYQGLTDKKFSIYFFGQGTGSGDLDIDNIYLNGIVTVPEPSTFGMIAAAFAFAFVTVRRRRRLG